MRYNLTIKSAGTVFATALLTLLAACKSTSHSSEVRDLGTGDDSNIASSGGARTVNFDDIETLKVLPNTKVPKGAFVALTAGRFGSNVEFVKALYNYIAKINKDDGLKPTLGIASPSRDELMSQEITLVVLVPKNGGAIWDGMLRDLGARDGKLPYLVRVDADTTAQDLWMQDWGEFAQVKLKSGETSYLVLDTYRNKNRRVFSPGVFKDAFKIPLVQLGDDADNSSQYGGNIEATPNGTLYMGDSVDDDSYSSRARRSELFDKLKQLGNPDAIKLRSNWLVVGHIDEYLTYVPSAGRCDSAMAYSRPLEGLKLMLTDATDAEWTEFSNELADENYGGGTLGTKLSREDVLGALKAFAKAEVATAADLSTELSGYDLTKADREFETIAGGNAMAMRDFVAFKGDKAKLAKFYVWRNLVDQKAIDDSVALLEADTGSACIEKESIPSPMMPYFNANREGTEVYYSKDAAHLPGMTNALILRDHAIVPDPGVAALRKVVTERLGKHLGSTDDGKKVHFIDDMVYHTALGEVHCGTNVVREADLSFKPSR